MNRDSRSCSGGRRFAAGLRRQILLTVLVFAAVLCGSSDASFPLQVFLKLNFALPLSSQETDMISGGYQRPPEDVTRILNAPPTPGLALSPLRDRILLIERAGYPPISDLAAPSLKLAGFRLNPQTNGPHLAPRGTGLVLQMIASGEQTPVQTPENANIAFEGWSPDGQYLAFTSTTTEAVELWIASATTGESRRCDGVPLNACFGTPVQWLPDSSGLLVQSIVPHRGPAPQKPATPEGPVIEESSGQSGPVRTYQDLLQNTHDERLFEYYCSSQLMRIDLATLNGTAVGDPAVFSSVDVSPDGQHLLLVRIRRPYSYLLPWNRFPRSVEVWSGSGQPEHTVASLPLEDRIPIEGVPVGPRSVGWRATHPATLIWLEALDEGDPSKKADHRDRLVQLSAPFREAPSEFARTEHRCTGLTWEESDGMAWLRDYDRDRRWTRTFRIHADHSNRSPDLLWERSVNDRYGDPGTPMLRPLPNGRRVIWQHENTILLESSGATPRGDRPFLDRFDLSTREKLRVFQCDEDSYESVVAVLNGDGTKVLTQHETRNTPPNFYERTIAADVPATDSGQSRRLTSFTDPMPELRNIHKELVTYQREDGVPLSFTLYLPPNHQPGTRLPTIVWAYPREYNDSGTAGQVSGSTNRFTTIRGISHLFLLTQGYAILDEATMPVVGPPETANDTFIAQIVASARAAIDKAVEMGVTDPDRVGIGGHSYGAFMTANLLAHSDLFKAGVARSGAYNRTLTPFGFQNERRTFWEAPEIYMSMSPFSAAHKIQRPVLLIHGAEDNNSGTFPIQSERLYHAIRGNGGTVRYVSLPHESHGYAARESIEHTLWEMITWFDRHLK